MVSAVFWFRNFMFSQDSLSTSDDPVHITCTVARATSEMSYIIFSTCYFLSIVSNSGDTFFSALAGSISDFGFICKLD